MERKQVEELSRLVESLQTLVASIRGGKATKKQDARPETVEKDDVLLDINDVAAMLRRSVRSVYDDVKAGRLPAGFRLGGRRRWRREDVESAIAKLANS